MLRRPHACFAPISLLASLLVTASACADDLPTRWLPVPQSELSLRDSSIEPGADAEILFTKTWVEDTYSDYLTSGRDHYVRLKVYTAAGAQNYSKVDIDYPLRDVHLSDVKARVVQPDGAVTEVNHRNIVEGTVVKKRGKGTRRTSIPLPGVTAGCVIEYRYHESRMEEQAWVQSYDFQFDVPAQVVAYFIKPLRAEGVFSRELTFHTAVRTPDQAEYGYYAHVATDQRPYVQEPDSPPEYQTRAWMLLYYTTEKLNGPEAFWHDYSKKQGEWAEPFTRPNKVLRELAATICAHATDDEAKVQALSDWMRHGFRILGSTSSDSLKAAHIHTNSDARDALRQMAGGAQDAEMAFIALARAAGLDARLLRVPSRSDMFFDANMMDGSFVRSFDAGIRIKGHWRGYDVASRYLPWDMVPWSEEMQPAVFCDPDSGGFITLGVAEPQKSAVSHSGTLTLSEDGTLEGDLRTTVSGHLNDEYRSSLEDVLGAQVDSVFLEALGWNSRAKQVSHVTLDRGSCDWDPLRLDYHMRMPEHAMITGKRMILQPAAMEAHEPARFTAGRRLTPIYFRHAWAEQDTLHIRLPHGWRVEALESPAPLRAEGIATYQAATMKSDDGHELLFVRTLVVGQGGAIYFPVTSYPDLKKLFDLIHDRDQSTVTLVREDSK